MSERDPALRVPYLAPVNVTRSARQPDEWQIGVIEPMTPADQRNPAFARGFVFAIPLSGALWVALYGLFKLCGG
ncbi:MAG: hypothetical protein JF628_05000 [Sphingomonas sp.]|nr:hypothetical protein [Sphingomonas sp.]